MRTLIVLGAVLLLVLIFNVFSKSSPQFAKKMLQRFAITAAVLLFVFLLLTGRLHWIFALVAAAVPMFRRLLPLLRYLPFLSQLYRRYQGSHTGQSGSGPTSSGRHSSVQSHYLKMTLDHDTGAMDGEIIAGRFQGQRLSTLPLAQLLELYQEVSVDNDSLALLHTYLERHHPGWNQPGESGERKANPAPPGGDMSVEEAREILGVAENASEEDIIAAHRRLMQKVHPDHGGSTYLAAKINLAKERLVA